MKLSLSRTKNEADDYILNNKFSVSFNGLSFFADEEHPLKAITGNSEEKLVLSSWKSEDELSVKLLFTDGSAILFTTSDTSKDATFSATAVFAPDSEISAIVLPYKTDNSLEQSSLSESRFLANSKTGQHSLTSYLVAQDSIQLIRNNNIAYFSPFTPEEKLTFESLVSIPAAGQDIWIQTKKQLCDVLVTLYQQTPAALITEKGTVAYLAEMLSRGDYANGYNTANALLTSTKRTYLSSPYFNNLVVNYASLSRSRNTLHSQLSQAIAISDISVFSIQDLGSYLLTESDNFASQVLSIPSNTDGTLQPSVIEAAGIIATYNAFVKAKRSDAGTLSPYLELCLSYITDSCELTENSMLFASENGNPLTTKETAFLADSLINYGTLSAQKQYEAAGYLLLNSIITAPQNMTLDEITDIYPLINSNSTTYPHYVALGRNVTNRVWTWTIADSFTVSSMQNNVITITMHFPLEHSHYITINGIPSFTGIEIYDMMFRTDPRFETYNSSGYSYNSQTQTLFLKSRHKSETETIRLYYNDAQKETTEPTETTAQPAAATTESAAQETATN